MVTCVLFCVLVGYSNFLFAHAFYPCNGGVSWIDTFEWNTSHLNFSKKMKAFYMLSLVTMHSVVVKWHWLRKLLPVHTVVPYVTNHWHSIATCCWVESGFCSIFDRILVRTSGSLADLKPHTNIRHLNCTSAINEILSRSHYLLIVPAYVKKSTVSHFVMFKQLKQMLKSEVHSLNICFKMSAVLFQRNYSPWYYCNIMAEGCLWVFFRLRTIQLRAWVT